MGAFLCLYLAACAQPSGDEQPAEEGEDTGTVTTETSTPEATLPGDEGDDGTSSSTQAPQPTTAPNATSGPGGQTTSSSSAPTTTTTTSETTSSSPGGTGTGSGSGEQLGEAPTKLPAITGECPNFRNGHLKFQPKGLKEARRVRVWMSGESKNLDGPLVFYWHGARSLPLEASRGMGTMIREVTRRGGIVVAPSHDPDAGRYPWFLTGGPKGSERMDDLVLADEILACAIKKIGVDTRHIHALGMSAGGLQTAQMSYRRSNYIASVATYSGGLISESIKMQNPDNKLAAMVFHGGAKDEAVLKFKETSERYLQVLRKDGNFGVMCAHKRGHRIPHEARDSVWQFFKDHPYNVNPKPYLSGLPSDFPDYCKGP